MGDGDYIYAFQSVVMPIAIEFDPDFCHWCRSITLTLTPGANTTLVAAGFDAAAGDELGGCFVTPPCYAI